LVIWDLFCHDATKADHAANEKGAEAACFAQF
jgi:hypothetical protein